MDDLKPGNVTSIKEARKKKKEAKEKPPQRAELFQSLADAINRSPFSSLPPFPRQLVVYSASLGMRVIGEVHPGDVVTIHDNDVSAEAAIMAYCNTELAANENYRWTAKAVREARDYWVMATEPLTDVAPYRSLSIPGYTFNRLPWDLCLSDDYGPTPTWDGLLARATNGVALQHWIGSLFYPDSDTHQYVWMFGQGGDGKGAINRFLARVFGGSYCAKQPPGDRERFWTFGLIGKRLVAFPDCNNVKFVTGGLFKSLTGGDPVDVEAKQKMSFTYRPVAKYLFFSNEKPMISSEKADTRRIIYCEFEPNLGGVDPTFEDRLWQEGGEFLSRCIAEYNYHCPGHGPIPCDQEGLFDHLSVVEELFEVVFERHFAAVNYTTKQLGEMPPEEARERSVQPRRMQEILQQHFKTTNRQGEFVKWLEIKHGVKKTKISICPGRRDNAYIGIAEKPDSTYTDYRS